MALAAGTEDHICTSEEKAAFACTFLFRPVCGDNHVTYPNGCNACKEREVVSYVMGACEN